MWWVPSSASSGSTLVDSGMSRPRASAALARTPREGSVSALTNVVWGRKGERGKDEGRRRSGANLLLF